MNLRGKQLIMGVGGKKRKEKEKEINKDSRKKII